MPAPRYVELVRVSSRGQAARDTPEDQRRALDGLRRSRPGTLVERIEQQVSGAAAGEDRPDLARLAELAAAKAFTEVRVRHLDRLTRHEDPLERAAVLSLVRRAGAVIVDAGGAVLDPTTMGGELTWVVSTLASAEERRKILERTIAAKRRLAAEGRMVSGFAPWGRAWDREKGWTLTPAAKGYRRLFALALAGRTLSQIAQRLEAERVLSPKGRSTWSTGMVWNLAKAEHAAGRWRSHGAEAEIPAIVDEATQRTALARLRSHDHAGGRHAQHPALLRKILVCGVCGAPCHTNRNTGGELYYHCSAGDRAHYRAHDVAAVDDAVRARLSAWLRRPGALALAGGVGSAGAEEARGDAAEAARELRRLDQEEERVARLGTRGGMSERTAAKMLREISARRAAAEELAESARARVAAAERRTELSSDLEARVAELRAGLERARFADWRELVELLFPREGGYSVAIWPTGRIVLRGALSLDAKGEEALHRARGKPPRPSRESWSIPVALEAKAHQTR